MKPTPDGFIYISQSGPVVADNEQLELRRESEEILPHEPGGDRISAGATAPVWEAEAVLVGPVPRKGNRAKLSCGGGRERARSLSKGV